MCNMMPLSCKYKVGYHCQAHACIKQDVNIVKFCITLQMLLSVPQLLSLLIPVEMVIFIV